MEINVQIDENNLVSQVWLGKWAPAGLTPVHVVSDPNEIDPSRIEMLDTIDQDDIQNLMLQGTFLVMRPVSPDLEKAGNEYRFSACPDQTTVLIEDLIQETVMAEITMDEADPDLTFTLPDTGRYRVSIAPPLPYLPAEHFIEVSDAS